MKKIIFIISMLISLNSFAGTMSLAEVKSTLKGAVKSYYKDKIFVLHPLEDMVFAIISQDASDLSAMKSDIQTLRSDAKAVIVLINSITDKDMFDDFVVSQNQTMINYLDSKLPGLSNNEQKESVIYGLQRLK